MRTPSAVFSIPAFRMLPLVALLLAASLHPTHAATLSTSLQGKYKLISATAILDGKNLHANITPLNLKIGAKGLNALTAAKIKKILTATSVGTGFTTLVTKTGTTTLSFSAAGTFGSNQYIVTQGSGSGSARLKSSGLQILLNFQGILNGKAITGSDTIQLKKS